MRNGRKVVVGEDKEETKEELYYEILVRVMAFPPLCPHAPSLDEEGTNFFPSLGGLAGKYSFGNLSL